MKKLLFTAAILAFSFNANAQCENYETAIGTSCGGFCASAELDWTGILEIDSKNLTKSEGTMQRQLTLKEEEVVKEIIEVLICG